MYRISVLAGVSEPHRIGLLLLDRYKVRVLYEHPFRGSELRLLDRIEAFTTSKIE